MPEKFDDQIMEDQHMVQMGENIVTCKTILRDPLSQIGKQHVCAGCGKTFDVVKMKPPVIKTDSGSPA